MKRTCKYCKNKLVISCPYCKDPICNDCAKFLPDDPDIPICEACRNEILLYQ